MEELLNQMDSISMEEEDADAYSSPELNYRRLIETIQTLESGFRLTEDWVEEHKKHILKYREMFPNFSNVNEEFGENEFRKKAYENEMVLANLVHEIKVCGRINLKLYLILNKHMKTMCEYIWTEDELANMMGDMGM